MSSVWFCQSLTNLPNEMLLEICSQLDVPSLVKTSEINRRLHDICCEIIKERKEDYLLEYKAKIILTQLQNGTTVILDLIDKIHLHGMEFESNLIVSKSNEIFEIYTAELNICLIAGRNYLDKIWPFQLEPKVWSSVNSPIYRGVLVTNDVEIIKQGLKKALQTGFKF